MEIGVQLAPSARPNVVFGRDVARPHRFVVRRRFLRPSAALALAVFYVAGWEQARALDSGDLGTLAGTTLLAWGALAVAFVRHRMVLDARLGELREELGAFFPFARRSRPIRDVRRVVVTDEVRPMGEDGRETRYAVDLDGGKARVRVDSVGLWEQAVPLAEALARFLRLPLRDARRAGELALDELDVPLREREPAEAAGGRPAERVARVTADRPALLRVEIPRPAVPQTAFLVGIVAAFCLIPLVVEGLSSRPDWPSAGFYLVPVLIVGTGALRYVARNGGTLSVTPEALRFARHGLVWRSEAVIAAEELEDLTLLEPEMGGARSLLAYFSSGVLVARSDRASCRFGYALPRAELEWLRRRILEVLRQGTRRFPSLTASEGEPPDASLPPFPRWSRLWLGMLAGGLAGRLVGGPLAVSVALPFVEEVLNTGAVVGLLAGAALTPSLFPGGGRRRVAVLVLGVLAAVALLSLGGLLQDAPSFDERWAFGSRPYGMVVDERRLRAGFFVASGLLQALGLNVLLLAGFRVTGGAWRPSLRALGAELASSVRAGEGIAPVPVLLGLGGAGVAIATLSVAVPPGSNRSFAISHPAPLAREAPPASPPPARPRATEPPVPAGPALVERPPGAPRSTPERASEPRAVLTGRLLFAGRPLHEATRETVRFWFRDEGTGREAALAVSHDPSSSGFRFAGPPGRYLVDVSAGGRLDFPPHVSFSGSRTFTIVVGAPEALDVPLQRILRLREPVDNARSLPPHGTPPRAYDSPVRFAWDPLPEASSYRVVLRPVGGGGPLPASDEREADRPAVELALAPGTYELKLSAHGPSGLVGRLEVYGSNYRAWGYVFSVR